jgi:hypothetical protein
MTPKSDLGDFGDVGGCDEKDPECDDICDPDFDPADFVDPIIKCSWTSSPVVLTPLVADLTGDGETEIIFVDHPTGALHVIKGSDCTDLVTGAARALWNQHAYHITNTNEDATIPLVENDNWDKWNNFRQNVGPNPDAMKPCKPARAG